jgi:hypothetical protein
MEVVSIVSPIGVLLDISIRPSESLFRVPKFPVPAAGGSPPRLRVLRNLIDPPMFLGAESMEFLVHSLMNRELWARDWFAMDWAHSHPVPPNSSDARTTIENGAIVRHSRLAIYKRSGLRPKMSPSGPCPPSCPAAPSHAGRKTYPKIAQRRLFGNVAMFAADRHRNR